MNNILILALMSIHMNTILKSIKMIYLFYFIIFVFNFIIMLLFNFITI